MVATRSLFHETVCRRRQPSVGAIIGRTSVVALCSQTRPSRGKRLVQRSCITELRNDTYLFRSSQPWRLGYRFLLGKSPEPGRLLSLILPSSFFITRSPHGHAFVFMACLFVRSVSVRSLRLFLSFTNACRSIRFPDA